MIFTLFILQNIIKNKTFNDSSITRLLITTIVIFSSLFLITAGFSSQQIAPITGLFGTIIGYMVGISSKNNNSNTPE